MQKIPTVFQRDYTTKPPTLTRAVTPGCEWVLNGEGVPTRKFDGVCIRLTDDRTWWARREVKPGKNPPPAFTPVARDEVTGKTYGWEPIAQSPYAKFHRQALAELSAEHIADLRPGTYELAGPRINGNPEKARRPYLVEHADTLLTADLHDIDGRRTFDTIRAAVTSDCGPFGWEGVVFHHPDGRRRAKIKLRDFERVQGTINVGSATLEYGYDPDPEQGYRVECRMNSGRSVAVFLNPEELQQFAREVTADAEAAA